MKFLSYESPAMQFLSKVGDLLILNLLFLVCSVPLVTLGAAQAGLFTAMRVFRDKENDSSCIKAFFRGFSTGFRRITALWSALAVLFVLLVCSVMGTWFFRHLDPNAPVVMSWVALCILGILEVLISLFHSRFNCTAWILLRNSGLFLLAYPVRCVLILVLTWLPLALILLNPSLFIELTMIFLLAYFSLAYWLILRITDKPFRKMIDSLNA